MKAILEMAPFPGLMCGLSTHHSRIRFPLKSRSYAASTATQFVWDECKTLRKKLNLPSMSKLH